KRPKVLIVGHGREESALKSLVLRLGLANYVIFSGRIPRSDVTEHYLAMDIIALPRKSHLLTRLVPAIKPYEVAAHRRPMFISDSLRMAIDGTLDESFYTVVDFDDFA